MHLAATYLLIILTKVITIPLFCFPNPASSVWKNLSKLKLHLGLFPVKEL